ncbi:MAG TPA: LysM domain-containing protein [Opitutaceae bacterium]|nr:LysM domain-containing protein [Opitutaceae bacterium]
MDTISRENNSMLPVGGIIVGVAALLLAAYAAVTLSKVNKSVAAHEEKIAKIESIEAQATSAAADAAKANKTIVDYARQTQDGFNTVGNELAKLREELTKMEAQKKAAPVAGKKSSEPVVAGPDEYVIKAGDTFSKIAAAQGLKASDISAVNPGVDSSKLHVGQKIKLPAK